MITDKKQFIEFIEKHELMLSRSMLKPPLGHNGFLWTKGGVIVAFQRVLSATSMSNDVTEYQIYPEDV